MGTRGLFGFRKKGQRKASHNNYDSNDLALEFTRFLVQISPAELVRLAKLVDELIWVDSDSPLEPTATIETYEHYGYNYEIFSSSSRGRYCWDDMRYAIQGVRSLYEILDGKLKHMINETDQLHSFGIEWSYFIDFVGLGQELQEVEIWGGTYEFALVSFDSLVEALHEFETSTERYMLFNVFLKEKFAIAGFGSEYDLNEEDYHMKVVHVNAKSTPELAKDEVTTSGHEAEQPALNLKEIAFPSAPGTLMALATELHLQIIRHLHVDSIETLPSLYDDGRVDIQTQWALKRTCKHFWNLSELIAPSDFFNLHHNLSFPAIKKREYQRLIIAAFAPSSFPEACFPCYNCRKFLPLDCLHPFWGGKFFFWNEQYLSCCITCSTEFANDAGGKAIEKMLCSDSRRCEQDEGLCWRLRHQLTRVQGLMSIEVQRKLVKAKMLWHIKSA